MKARASPRLLTIIAIAMAILLIGLIGSVDHATAKTTVDPPIDVAAIAAGDTNAAITAESTLPGAITTSATGTTIDVSSDPMVKVTTSATPDGALSEDTAAADTTSGFAVDTTWSLIAVITAAALVTGWILMQRRRGDLQRRRRLRGEIPDVTPPLSPGITRVLQAERTGRGGPIPIAGTGSTGQGISSKATPAAHPAVPQTGSLLTA